MIQQKGVPADFVGLLYAWLCFFCCGMEGASARRSRQFRQPWGPKGCFGCSEGVSLISENLNRSTETMTIDFKNYLQEKTGITEEQYHLLETHISFRTVEKGTVLLRQDEVCSEVYFVLNGLLRSYALSENDKVHIIQFAPEEWWIGDRDSFYFGEPSAYFIDALEETELVVFTRNFFDVANRFPGFSIFHNRTLHNHIRLLQKRLQLLMGATAEQRYLDFVDRYPSLTLRVPQWMIASYLGITAESLSRVRKELAHKNFRPATQHKGQ